MDYERQTRPDRTFTAPPGMTGPVGIRKGVQVTNKVGDQHIVMSLLNRIPMDNGGALSALGPTVFKAPRSGFCDPGLAGRIHHFQELNRLKADSVVDVNGATFRTMQAFAALATPIAGRMSGRVLARLDTPLALKKIDKALGQLKEFRDVIILRLGPIVRIRDFDRVTEEALRVHFRFASFGSGVIAPLRAVKLEDVDHIMGHYRRMKSVLQQHATSFEDGLPKDKNNRVVPAAAPLNGGRVIFSAGYRNFNAPDGMFIGENSRAAILIHEGMHAVDIAQKSGADDIHISEFKPEYDSQPPDKSLFNPSSFASFASHVSKGADPSPRFGLGPGRFL